MANEIRVTAGLQVRKGSVFYQSRPGAFTADWAGLKGPTPGSITVSIHGTIIDLSQLNTRGGPCRFTNNDDTNYVEYGIYDVGLNRFYPLGSILPGEDYVIRLSPNIQEDYTDTGTGTSGQVNRFFFKANVADCDCVVDCFDK